MTSPPESGAIPPASKKKKEMTRLSTFGRACKYLGEEAETYSNASWQNNRWIDVPNVRGYPLHVNFRDNYHKLGVKEYLERFLKFYQRWEKPLYRQDNPLLENKIEYWIQEVDRCELDLVTPRLIYWSKMGRVTRFKILEPELLEDFSNNNKWKVIAFHDFHQDLPLIMSLAEFERHHGTFLTNWYSNWRKWSYEIGFWHHAADDKVVPLTTKESQESIANRSFFESCYRRMDVCFMKDWELFDATKTRMKREDYLRGYYKDDPTKTIPGVLAVQKILWYKDRAILWNQGVMREDGSLDPYLLNKHKFGDEAYQGTVNSLRWNSPNPDDRARWTRDDSEGEEE